MDTLLRKLDDFEQLLLLSQSDTNVCLFKHVPGLQTKLSEMQDVFDKVDRYKYQSFIRGVFIPSCSTEAKSVLLQFLSSTYR